ncbi:YolD-like family protein [Neobacillus sp. Marseille-QA0830]
MKDRGLKKWQFAFGHPELIKGQQDLWHDTERMAMPIIDEYEAQEFDERICYAMEYNFSVSLTVWDDGFTSEITGRVHYVDPITHELSIEVKPREFDRVTLDCIVGVKVID